MKIRYLLFLNYWICPHTILFNVLFLFHWFYSIYAALIISWCAERLPLQPHFTRVFPEFSPPTCALKKPKQHVNDPRGQKSSSASLAEPGRYAASPVKTEWRRAAAVATVHCLSLLPQRILHRWRQGLPTHSPKPPTSQKIKSTGFLVISQDKDH